MPATRAARRAAARQQMAAGVPTYDGLGDDVQDCIVASMNVTSILTYGACSRAAHKAGHRIESLVLYNGGSPFRKYAVVDENDDELLYYLP